MGIGKETAIFILHPGGESQSLTFADIKKLRPMWEKTKVNSPPAEALSLIIECLEKDKTGREERKQKPKPKPPTRLGSGTLEGQK